MREKVTVVGSGFVGTMVAQRIAEKKLADCVLLDIVEGIPQGKALDIIQSASLEGFDCVVTGTNDPALMAGSRIIVVTAGFPRTPGMSRDDLAAKNGAVITSVVDNIRTYAPQSIIIMVTNPLDVMTHLALVSSGFPAARVMGMGGILDTARYTAFLARELGVSVSDVNAMVLGSHGDSMVPVESCTTVKGIPIDHFIEKERREEIIERTRQGGAEIVNLLKTGSAWHAPSASTTVMVEAIITDSKRLVPVSAFLRGEYGIDQTCIGVPVILGASGVEKICEIPLAEEELAALRRSAAVSRAAFDTLNRS